MGVCQIPNGTKIWIELEALTDDTFLSDLPTVVAAHRDGMLDGMQLNMVILNESYFNQDLKDKLVRGVEEVLRSL